MKTKLAAGFAVCTLIVASACGGGGRPSVSEISESIQEESGELSEGLGSLDEETADCIAEVLHGSDVSDEALRAGVDGEDDYDLSDDDEEAFAAVEDEFVECIMGDMELPE